MQCKLFVCPMKLLVDFAPPSIDLIARMTADNASAHAEEPVMSLAEMVNEARMRQIADLRDQGAVMRWKYNKPFWAGGCFDKHPIARARLEKK